MYIDYQSFSGELTSSLESAGWYPGRRVDLATEFEFNRTQGYNLHPYAREFLEAFHGIEVEPLPTSDPGLQYCDPLIVDVYLGAHGDSADTKWLNRELGGHWYPVGEWNSKMALYIDSTGAVVCTGLGWHWFLGPSIEESLELAVRLHRPLRCLNLRPGTAPAPPYDDGLWFKTSIENGKRIYEKQHYYPPK
ncbi:SUKH-3 domain-containing protein [Natronoglycomyces albus]|uniref:SUKH-3 domain-containing protein n=1 Tax=Natronoglycomyces albus TaxID=2811108 RepID=A0A895XMS6_9ACTN|nr:SUKH-3 domain-containing protein [Natronoglycomyces albus]QSB05072.1 SUKH-3 domain-containing protein [Natronoglycomyces albus]